MAYGLGAFVPDVGPCVVTARDGTLLDITSRDAPAVRDIMEMDDPASYVAAAPGRPVEGEWDWLAPCDLQAVKACGVTFAGSMVERVIEEQAAGDAAKAEDIRNRVAARIGDSLNNIVPGSAEAEKVTPERSVAVKPKLIRAGRIILYSNSPKSSPKKGVAPLSRFVVISVPNSSSIFSVFLNW